MTWLSLALFGFVVILTIAWRVGRDGPVAEPDRGFDDEAAMRAAVELHLIRRRLDVAWLRTRSSHEAAVLRRGLRQELDPESQDQK